MTRARSRITRCMTQRLTRRTARHGFTLVEVLVALLIASMVALLAHRLFAAATEGTRALTDARAELDRRRNVERFLAAALLSLEVGGPGSGAFEGRAGEMQFTTWLETPEGWFRRERLTLAVRDGRLVAVRGAGPLVLADHVTGVGFDYLLELGAGERWATEWVSPVSAPIAVRLRLARTRAGRTVVDTALYLIKGRG